MTVVAPFGVEYVSGELIYPLETEITIELFGYNIHMDADYECVLTSEKQIKVNATVRLNNIKTAPLRGRNYRHVVMCQVPAQY